MKLSIKTLKARRGKARCGLQDVKYPMDGERVPKQDESVMLPEMGQSVPHELQCLHPASDSRINGGRLTYGGSQKNSILGVNLTKVRGHLQRLPTS